MRPIKKIIYVTDKFGNEYTPTYPKRAAGLVKHGRAHYVSDDTICLVCSPLSSETEEPIMDNTKTVEQPEIIAAPATGGITLKTALRILDTISRNANESVAFWASKTAYSGVYRTAVQNGWIEDGVYVTDIPEGVDGGFLAADMRRIALMARLLADVLSDRLPEQETVPSQESTSAAIHASIDSAIREHLKEFLSEQELDVAIAEAFASAMEELEALKDEIEALRDEALAEIESAKTE